jgi:hypothetical protein
MFNFFKIALNTFKEAVREPVFFLMLLAAQLVIAHTPSVALYVFSEQMKLVVDSSMATALMFGLVIAVLTTSHTVTREMQNGTVLLLLSKPVHRWSFILGKIFGISVAVALFAVLCNCSSVVAVYVAADQYNMDLTLYFSLLGAMVLACAIGMAANFWRGSAFPEIATYAASIFLPIVLIATIAFKECPINNLPHLFKALVMVDFSVIAMAAIAVVFATRLNVVANLCVCSVIFFLGLVSGYLFQGSFYRSLDGGPVKMLFDGLYAIIPNWQYFWLADAVAVARPIPTSYLIYGAVYLCFYITICAMWAVALFQNREVAGDNRM